MRTATTVSSRRPRRSLRSLLQIPLLTRSQGYRDISVSKPFGTVPADIILEIADRLAPADILNCSLTSSRLRALLLPALYSTVLLRSSRKCRVTLNMLANRPDICVHIRKLAVRPNYYLAWPKPDDPLDEDWVVCMIEKIAKSLTSLHTFDWDGLEMPDNRLWTTLQTCCPQLRTVFSNVGFGTLDAECQLFEFSNLTSFSLIIRHGLGGSDLFPPMQTLPERLWDMILNRCPDLEEVTICSFSSSARLFDFQRITSGRWPKLHTLTLGSFGYQNDFTLSPPNEFLLGEFLAAHPSLKYVRLSWNFKRWMSPESVPLYLPPTALPELTTFIGIYQQLAELPNPSSIETLDLTCEPIYETRLPAICAILRKLTSLTSLDIWTHIPDPNGDHHQFFNSILASCPKLTDLHFMCTTPFTIKPLQELSNLLEMLPELKTFSLTKGHQYRDEPMLESALHIIRQNPSIQQVNIRWAREKCPNHLKQEGSYDVSVNETTGKPVSVMVHERGIRLIGKSFSRQFKYDLREGSVLRVLARKKLTHWIP